MDIYLAAKYDRRNVDLREIRDRLESIGHSVTSRWIDGAEEDMELADAARMDLDDVESADVVIFFGEPKGSVNRGGGRWFELGYAHALGRRCMAILPPPLDPTSLTERNSQGHESVFTALPDVECFYTIDEAIGAL